ncbi:MAG TPA: phospho-N-acetylmuramoyl-pentapeptide-transferase [Candidatus Paceibacterota bacterium]|jgi:phospho-N-acetylmuramoyl-pentapeptide-transferase|nr:phospho-N-acetylmuramoyl-pentapeptide-transferase [Candidatus Paceibacterota bacterium]
MLIIETVRVIVLTTIAFIVALIVTPLWFKFLQKNHLDKQLREEKDAPVFYELHKKKAGTPTGGGIIIWSTVVGMAIVFGVMDHFFDGTFWRYLNFWSRPETYLPLGAFFATALIGFADDWLGVKKLGGASGGGLKVRYKSILYLLVAAAGAWWFYFRLQFDVINVPFLGNYHVGWWYIPIFIFIVFASAFSANETDGLDGLLGGTALFAFLGLTTVAFVLGRYDLAAFGGAVIGALLAFLWYNIYPARFFMGDTGAMSLGITIGIIAMLTNTALLLPFFAIILVVESISVIIQIASRKLRRGKKVFRSSPIHHHFEALGWPESQITMRFWIISAMACALGLVIFFVAQVLK